MEYPKYLFRDIYWSFTNDTISTSDEFVRELEEYYKEITGKKFPLKWNEIAFNYPKIELQYVKYIDDDLEEPFEELVADNNKNFSVKELLFKIHLVGINLKDDDNCYFEGITFANDDNEGVPIYFLDTGS